MCFSLSDENYGPKPRVSQAVFIEPIRASFPQRCMKWKIDRILCCIVNFNIYLQLSINSFTFI